MMLPCVAYKSMPKHVISGSARKSSEFFLAKINLYQLHVCFFVCLFLLRLGEGVKRDVPGFSHVLIIYSARLNWEGKQLPAVRPRTAFKLLGFGGVC